MKRLVLACAVLALAACERRGEIAADPAAQCQNLEDAAARIAVCTAVIDNAGNADEIRAAAFVHRADAQYASGSVTPALRDYEAALRLQENNNGALLGRAGILLASGQLDAAEPLAQRALEQNASARAHEILGQVALRRGEYDAAVSQFDEALDAERSASALAGRARAKLGLEDLDGATADFDAAVRLDGTYADARAGRCWLDLRQTRQLDRARTDAETAVAAEPNNVEAQLCRGVLQLRGGEWANARTSFERVLEVEPGNPTALFGRGVARRRSGDNAGRQDMNQARDFNENIGGMFDDWGVETY